MTSGASGLLHVKSEIEKAARDCGREPSDIALVVAAKTQAVDRIVPLLAAGHRIFGENRVQEALAKWPDLKSRYPDIELHMIGPLQSNKAEEAVSLFDVIETVDRLSLVKALKKAMAKLRRHPRLFVEINTGSEPQKAGVDPKDADAFIAMCREDYQLDIEGLMCIPPANQLAAPHFAFLAQIAERNGIRSLSMGMSADFTIAIQLGATHVRVGTAVFGGRD